jgi:propanol-preferring alcohol dehydrogenase
LISPQRVGERVAAYFYLSCGACGPCLAGFEPLCEHFGGNVGVACDGGYAEFCVLPAFNALPLADGGIDAALATAIPDAIATPVHVARLARLGPRSRVVVIAAAGGVGIHMLQVARAYGADVFGLDAVPEKLDFLERELHVPAADSSEFGASLLPAAWRERVDVVVDLLGRPESLEWALRQLAPNGRLVCLTTFRDVEVCVSPRQLVLAQASILGSRYASRWEVSEAAGLVADGRLQPVVSGVVPLERVGELHARLRARTLLGRGAIAFR